MILFASGRPQPVVDAIAARRTVAASYVIGEPFRTGHQRPNVLLYYLLHGFSFAEASTLGITSFDGQSVDASTIVMRYTFMGDANLDGLVNALDFNALASNYGSYLAPPVPMAPSGPILLLGRARLNLFDTAPVCAEDATEVLA